MQLVDEAGQPIEPRCELLRIVLAEFGEGQVQIQDAGVAAQLITIWTPRGHQAKVEVYGESYFVCCPWCFDTQFSLWISHLYGQPDPVTGRPMLLAKCKANDCLKQVGVRQVLWDRLLGFRNRDVESMLRVD